MAIGKDWHCKRQYKAPKWDSSMLPIEVTFTAAIMYSQDQLSVPGSTCLGWPHIVTHLTSKDGDFALSMWSDFAAEVCNFARDHLSGKTDHGRKLHDNIEADNWLRAGASMIDILEDHLEASIFAKPEVKPSAKDQGKKIPSTQAVEEASGLLAPPPRALSIWSAFIVLRQGDIIDDAARAHEACALAKQAPAHAAW